MVQFDLPVAKDDFDAYVHRIGRTGRAGRSGRATAFFVPGYEPKVRVGCPLAFQGPFLKALLKIKDVCWRTRALRWCRALTPPGCAGGQPSIVRRPQAPVRREQTALAGLVSPPHVRSCGGWWRWRWRWRRFQGRCVTHSVAARSPCGWRLRRDGYPYQASPPVCRVDAPRAAAANAGCGRSGPHRAASIRCCSSRVSLV